MFEFISCFLVFDSVVLFKCHSHQVLSPFNVHLVISAYDCYNLPSLPQSVF